MSRSGCSAMRRIARACALACLSTLCACSPKLELGSNVLWSTSNESGDLTDWYLPPGGGIVPDTSMSPTPAAVKGIAHTGSYSVLLSDLAASDTIGPGVYRELDSPPDAYYSAWYFIPRQYQTKSQWTIMKFRSRSDDDPNTISHGHDLNLRALPGGQVILYVYSHDPMYLQAPLADPPAIVPVEAWFQLEVLYRPRTDETGKILVWLDDRLVYDLEQRRTAGSNDLVWSPCNVGEDVEPLGTPTIDAGDGEGNEGGAGGASSSDGGALGEAGASSAPRTGPELYVDDAAISLTRVTRTGVLR